MFIAIVGLDFIHNCDYISVVCLVLVLLHRHGAYKEGRVYAGGLARFTGMQVG